MKKPTKTQVKRIIVGILVFIVTAVIIAIPTVYSYGYISSIHNLKDAEEGQMKIACVGDSITYGFGVSAWYMNNYPKVLQKSLGDGYCVNNYGYSGRTASFTGDKPYIQEKTYKQSLEFKPDLVIIMLGSNDSKSYNWEGADLYKKYYKLIIQSYLDIGAKVIMMLQPPVFQDGKYDINESIIKDEIRPAELELANELGLKYIDLYPVFKDKSSYYTDGVHPNREGANLLAETVYNYLTNEFFI